MHLLPRLYFGSVYFWQREVLQWSVLAYACLGHSVGVAKRWWLVGEECSGSCQLYVVCFFEKFASNAGLSLRNSKCFGRSCHLEMRFFKIILRNFIRLSSQPMAFAFDTGCAVAKESWKIM